MTGTLAVDDGFGSSRRRLGEPYVLPLAVFAAPECFGTIQLAGAFSDAAQAVDAGLDGHLATALDGIDLLRERIQPSALACIGEQSQFIVAATRRNGAADQLRLFWGPKGKGVGHLEVIRGEDG